MRYNPSRGYIAGENKQERGKKKKEKKEKA